jgi:hypothetical protein
MPEIRLTDAQLERLDAVCADVAAAYVGRYGRVTPADAVDYLLDTYTPPDDTGTADGASEATGSAGVSSTDTASNGSSEANGSGKSAKPSGGSSPLAAAAALLDDNDDVWRESSGDAPYEVDLPDGSTEAVRTKDDVKRLLFKHYR